MFFIVLLFWAAFLAWALAETFAFIRQSPAAPSRIDYFIGKISRGPVGKDGFFLWICWIFYAIPALLSFTKSKCIEKHGAVFLTGTLVISTCVLLYQHTVWVFQYQYSANGRVVFVTERAIEILSAFAAILMPYLLAWKITNTIFGRLMPEAEFESASDT